MTAHKRLVLDTNLLVSGMLLRGSASRQVIVKASNEGLFLASEATLVELLQVFQRPKFDRAVRLELREALVREYAQRCQIVAVHSRIQACRDARDNKFLELALDGRADLILTGDQDLLTMSPFRGIPILSPTQYLAEE
jgi:putative PIN family toxin of toxin-antitoxin system